MADKGTSCSVHTGVHSYQYLNGNNSTGVNLGIRGNISDVAYNLSGLAGYDFNDKEDKPLGSVFGSLEQQWGSLGDISFSQELFGQAIKEEGFFTSKLTYTPAKISSNLGCFNLSFDPRLALKYDGHDITPKVETHTTLAAPLTGDKKLSAYLQLSTYDTENLFSHDCKDDISINAGISYTFK